MAHFSNPQPSKTVFWYWPVLILRVTFAVLARIGILLLLVGAGFYAIVINDQGKDMLRTFQTRSIWDGFEYLNWFYFYLIIWATALWYAARILFSAANLQKLVERTLTRPEQQALGHDLKANEVVYLKDPHYEKAVKFLQAWIPRVLLLLPYLAFFIGNLAIIDSEGRQYPFNYWLALIIGISHLLVQVYRLPLARLFSRMVGRKSPPLPPTDNNDKRFRLSAAPGMLSSIDRVGVRTYTWLMGVVAIFMIGHVVSLMRATPGFEGKPGLIIVSALALFTFLSILVHFISNRLRFPVFTLALGLAFFVFGIWNNNHHIQTIPPTETNYLPDSIRLTDTAYAQRWLDRFYAANPTQKKDTIFLITAEGGGIRNCYWTFAILNKLNNHYQNFHARTFAASGVSGGSIGIGCYYNFHRLSPTGVKIDSFLSRICGADYLTGVTYGLLFPDLLQRFLPVAIPAWDRARYLIDGFDEGFSAQLNQAKKDKGYTVTRPKYLSDNYLSAWYTSKCQIDSTVNQPALLFNTTVNELGTKGLFAPYRLSPNYYPDALDLLDAFHLAVPMKEAMGSSARFPLITPPGLIRSTACNSRFIQLSISDGGIFENTGIQTIQSTARLLKDLLKKRGDDSTFIKIIYIGTGTRDINNMATITDSIKDKKTVGFGLSFISGAYKSIFRWINSVYLTPSPRRIEWPVTKYGLDISPDDKQTIDKKGRIRKYLLPLGWYLSDDSRFEIERQAQCIPIK